MACTVEELFNQVGLPRLNDLCGVLLKLTIVFGMLVIGKKLPF